MKPATYFARDGKLWRRSEGFPDGCYLAPQVARNLVVLHDAALWSKPLANQLRRAMAALQTEQADA